MEDEFYVYMYLDQDNVPFYIGKGKNNRHTISLHLSRHVPNRLLKNKIHKVGSANVKVIFLHENLSEENALRWERYWIKYIGRRDLKEGSLCNLTDGGEGVSGIISPLRNIPRSDNVKKKISKTLNGHRVSKESRQKLSEKLKGKEWPDRQGVPLSVEHRRKLSIACKGRVSPRKGKKLTATTKKKISTARKGKVPWNKGKPMSEEQKRKISETKLRQHREKQRLYTLDDVNSLIR